MKNTHIKITDRFEGFHSYPDAPDEVAFLKHNHRHVFHVTLVVEVFSNDRELEFFMVKEQLKRACAGLTIRFGNDLGSCEHQADYILESLKKLYGNHRLYQVEVSEDGENGALVSYEPEKVLIPSVWVTNEHNSKSSGTNEVRENNSGVKIIAVP